MLPQSMAALEALNPVPAAGVPEKVLSSAEQDRHNARDAWVHGMRARFSPANLVSDDGTLNQDFFKPERVVFVTGKRWGAEEKERLYQGLEKHGVGRWREIGEELLPQWDDQFLRIKTGRLFGSQSLARYVGWKGSKSAVEAEYQKNKVLGESLGCWRGGVLVENDAGDVRKALAEQADGDGSPAPAPM